MAKMNTGEVRDALRKRFSDTRRYAVAEEVGLTTGYSPRRLDMVVLDCYSSNGFRIDGIEIKVSTSDLRRELEVPEKHIAFFDKIDYYTLAAPAGIVEPVFDIIPKKWGILIVNEDGTTRYKRRPLALEDAVSNRPVSRGFFASVTRAIQERQPAQAEIDAAYKRGRDDAAESAKRDFEYSKRIVQENADKIKAYDDLVCRCHLWGEDINDAIDEFIAFRSLNLRGLRQNINNALVALNNLGKNLSAQNEEVNL